MYNSSLLKSEARKRLAGVYLPAVVGALIFMIPTYLLSLIDSTVGHYFENVGLISVPYTLLIKIFVTDIMAVGFIRFLMQLKPHDKDDELDVKQFDFETVLSGYTNNFKNTLKTTFMRTVYLTAWGLLTLVPLFIFVGIIAYMASKTTLISDIYSLSTQFMNSPTIDMANNLSNYISQNVPYMPIISLIVMIATIALVIPFIYKTYEYMAVPMILAEHPDMETKRVFKRTRDIMHGFRMRYFLIGFSFVLWEMLTALLFSVTGSELVFYIAI